MSKSLGANKETDLNSEDPRLSSRRHGRFAIAIAACAAALALPAGTALAGGGGISTDGGGGDQETTSGDKAKLKANGKAIAPASAPRRVKEAIEAANRIDDKPYRYGGGHGSWNDSGYDCLGAVSYALGPKGAGLISSPMASGGFTNWGRSGKGKWITTYANSGHMFVVIAGLRFDTSQPDDGKSGPGWSKDVSKGFVNVSRSAARHKGNL
ncbi:MAG: hypothetical protein M3331_03655 [Actinomycetota bacterium]|nr:hypothetical protein [Actinomycetota bacterium]